MKPQPIDILLACPNCGTPHLDAPDPGSGWSNPPHTTHLCGHCGHLWKPSNYPTNGVATIGLDAQTCAHRHTRAIPSERITFHIECTGCGSKLANSGEWYLPTLRKT